MNSFTAMPSTTPATPRPVVVGQQIALVAGRAGEEIDTGQYGRVKLTFPWDRRAKGDGSDTCWVPAAFPGQGFAVPDGARFADPPELCRRERLFARSTSRSTSPHSSDVRR